MKKIKKKINFKDNRGIIVELLEKKNINAITFITQKKGKIRGNHFHKKTIQWNYLLKGRVELTTKKNKQKIKKTLMKEGDLIETSIEYVETLFEYHHARTQLFHAIGQTPVSPIPEN